jgi:hypothetical protein
MALVVAMNVRRQEPMHPAPDVAGYMRHDHEMEVVGHEASGQEVEPETSLSQRDQTDKRAVFSR